MTALVRVDVRDGVASLTLDSPATRNALSDAMLDELLSALRDVREDDDVRVVVLASSHETVFSAGGDLKAFAGDSSTLQKFDGLDRFPQLFQELAGLGKPVICAAGGDVLAGAFGLALACDLVIACEGVRFGCPEINVGVFPFMISALIYRNVPRMRANQMMMLGELVTADEALRLGFVNEVVARAAYDDTVEAWASRIASRSPLLMRMGKDALAASRDLALPEALSLLRAQLALAFTTSDMKEGVAAFREKRAPEWQLR